MIMATEQIVVPIIDLEKYEVEKEKFMKAVLELGCFRVINHGISKEIMTDMKASVGNIFELPFEVKKRNIDVILGSGYVEPNQLSLPYEGLGIYDASLLADIHTFCSLLDISFHDKEILSTFTTKLHNLTVDLASKVAEGLGILQHSFQDWRCHLRMNRYNFTEETAIGSCGVPLHTDNSFITVILEDDSNEGFEFMDATGQFVVVDPFPGTFLVNIGDIGKVWSNGRLHNVKHRVLCKKAKPRITVVLFMQAPTDNKIEPQVDLIDSEHPQLYRSFDYLEYRNIRNSTLSLDGNVIRRWAIDEATIMA